MSLLPRHARAPRLLLPIVLAMLAGCEEPDVLETERQTGVLVDVRQPKDLDQGLDFLARLDEFESMQAQQKIQYHLQQWLKKQTPDANWQPDPMMRQLPERYHPLISDEQLRRLEFDQFDIQMLQEATWFRDVARTVIEQSEVAPDLSQLILAATSTVEPVVADDLAHATRLFDWTVRNLLFDDFGGRGDTDRIDAPLLFYAWESLLLGRGNDLERARVFILLARQIGLPVVMLAIDHDDLPARPWLPALLIDDQLFLFDMRLGVPVPALDGHSIATLADVLDHPEILENLAERSRAPYPVGADELDRVVALVDAPPVGMSQRMAILERALMGDRKMVLAATPSALASSLSQCRGVSSTQLWTLPCDAIALRGAIPPEARQWLMLEHRLFDRTTPLAEARVLQFRGRLNPEDERPGARELYMECRAPDTQIGSLRSMPLKVPKGAQPPTTEQLASYQSRINDVADFMVRTKQNATYWLGLIAFDRGSYDVALDYFGKRLLERHPQGMWSSGARYNLGRSYEAIAIRDGHRDDWKNALEAYRTVEKSPWTPACQLRAFAIQQRIGANESLESEQTELETVDEAKHADETTDENSDASDANSAPGDYNESRLLGAGRGLPMRTNHGTDARVGRATSKRTPDR